MQLVTTQAMKAGFTGGLVIDYPNSAKAKKWAGSEVWEDEVIGAIIDKAMAMDIMLVPRKDFGEWVSDETK